jgi:DNA-binding MarR family transcriptional regulator
MVYLNVTQNKILDYLINHKAKKNSPSQISSKISVKKEAIEREIRNLERNGLVDFQLSPSKKRIIKSWVTEAGEDYYKLKNVLV